VEALGSWEKGVELSSAGQRGVRWNVHIDDLAAESPTGESSSPSMRQEGAGGANEVAKILGPQECNFKVWRYNGDIAFRHDGADRNARVKCSKTPAS